MSEDIPSVPIEPAKNLLLEYFRESFPEFNDVPDTRVLLKIAVSKQLVSKDAWGEGLYPHGIGLYTAHQLALDAMRVTASGGVNPDAGRIVVSKSVGGASVAYAAASVNVTQLESTSYGREYKELSELLGVGCLVLC